MKFIGHERDLANAASAADDLDYMHARFYNPLTGRFLSVDPVLGRADSPQSWNRYPYALNKPLIFVDRDGRAWETALDLYSYNESRKNWGEAFNRFYQNPSLENGIDAAGKFLANAYDSAAMMLPVLPGGAGLLQRADNAVGFARGTAGSALTPDRLQHASRHLIEAGVLGKWNKQTANEFVQLASNILENPSATFDATIRGGNKVKGFIGTAKDRTIVILVFKDGPNKGKIATSVVPSAKQLEKLLK